MSVRDEIKISVSETYWRLNPVDVCDDEEGDFNTANNVAYILGGRKRRIS